MIDDRLRVAKDRVVGPLVGRMPATVTPGRLTTVSLMAGVAAGALAAAGSHRWALVAWLAGRLLDGVDGAVARRLGRQSDLGGYLDLIADTVAYAVIPLGIAASQDAPGIWAACAVLLGTFYLNTMSWTLLSAIAEKRAAGAAVRGERTTVHMPAGLVEGAETIVLFSLALTFPARASTVFWVMAVLVMITVSQRVFWASRSLR